MTAKIPIWQLRIDVYNKMFIKYLKMSNRYDRGEIFAFERKEQYLLIMRTLYKEFYKYLRDLLREENILEPLPKKIFILCREKNIYTEIEDWLYFIDLLNEYNEIKDNLLKEELLDYILKTFKYKFYHIHQYFKITYPLQEYKKQLMQINQTMDTRNELSYNNVEYNADFVKMTEKSYERLLNFFKSNKEIKLVWMQGSRVFGITRGGSDIDLIIDSPLEAYDALKEKMYKIQTPYRIDAKNLNSNTLFIKTATFLGTKLIYNIDDWQ